MLCAVSQGTLLLFMAEMCCPAPCKERPRYPQRHSGTSVRADCHQVPCNHLPTWHALQAAQPDVSSGPACVALSAAGNYCVLCLGMLLAWCILDHVSLG